ncbi:hypothetical protein AGABI1DRAFT_131469 [Agaricus bisporus var. burnettii JB137-S8]|uniref:Nephrocystin 3-like N-terminal domain-containing protein n=1 Tax=Agaricus bisporus var. burnettii (strain JB137-S8 / ATCC MYA-4627 / FGSC 10392) TaxID=597362 RepID=K5WM39_AGABU|nr:uncharacterized protein AGABI1DRAFT_131469 [Agaricus bisporus var. burnettii JB137-S8]EKM76386.1 hypothetical protein AGABI1DRAFT_131469 [Agaricus bisporus var. burnettii JB137-S8]
MSPGAFQEAHDFILNNPQFIYSHVHTTNHTINNDVIAFVPGSGIQMLLQKSMPDAFHDSSARYPPPRCHTGTREALIKTIIDWGNGASNYSDPILWVYGRAGVGKSAVAQSSAEAMNLQGNLGAAVFLSQSSEDQDSRCLFTSITYQIAIKCDTFSSIVDYRIRKDPTLVDKSITEQFRELLIKPLQELGEKERARLDGWVIIIDGLDECEGMQAQCDIVEIVATSIRERTTPFRWIFLSRPERHLSTLFTKKLTDSVSRHLELPVSREIDHEILLYLSDELKTVQETHNLQSSWPSEKDLTTLVNLSAGLWIYAVTVCRFIIEPNSSGPVDQLDTVLSLATPVPSNTSESDHPLTELDMFYTLIMRRVFPKVLPTVLQILLLHSLNLPQCQVQVIPAVANILGLSELQLRNACSSLQSVLEITPDLHIRFYHASFGEFIRNPTRSKEFCIYSSLEPLRNGLLNRLNSVHSHSTETNLIIDVTWPNPEASGFWPFGYFNGYSPFEVSVRYDSIFVEGSMVSRPHLRGAVFIAHEITNKHSGGASRQSNATNLQPAYQLFQQTGECYKGTTLYLGLWQKQGFVLEL